MTPEQYVDVIQQVILQNFQPNDPTGSMTVARIGWYARMATGVEPAQVGFAKFRDALAVLEQRGVIRLGENSKNALAAWLLEADAGAPSSQVSHVAAVSTRRDKDDVSHRRFRRLRNGLWIAVVSTSLPGRKFIHRTTGDIRWNLEDPPEPNDSWVEIPHADPVADRADALAFLVDEERASNAQLKTALESDTWFHHFPLALRDVDPLLAARWNRRRSNRVISEVETWAQNNQLPDSVIFDANERPTFRTSPESVQPTPTQDVRSLVLCALRRMTTEELLRLPIPARHMLAVARPELVGV